MQKPSDTAFISRDRFIQGTAIAIAAGVLLGILLIAAVFATGSTFGQRCKPLTGDEWRACVDRLASGASVEKR
jgi:hypothetical protein